LAALLLLAWSSLLATEAPQLSLDEILTRTTV